MNTIETIRAEIERRKGYISVTHFAEELLSFLSDIEKECEKPTNIDFEQELYKHFGQVKDFTLGMQIGKYFYELGKQEKPNDQWSEEDNIMVKDIINAIDKNYASSDWHEMVDWLKSLHLKVKSEKPTTAEGLEEEMERFMSSLTEKKGVFPPLTRLGFKAIARHFYELGRQSKQTEWTEKDEKMFRDAWWHISYSVSNGASTDDDNGITRWLKDIRNRIQQSKPKVSEGLEEEIKRWLKEGEITDTRYDDYGDNDIEATARHFAQWQKDNMMKEAVETWMIEGSMCEPEFFKRKVIIIKEEQK